MSAPDMAQETGVASVRRILARHLLPRFLWLARAITPARRTAVVHGFPSTEGNAVEILRALESFDLRRIYWLDSPGEEYARALGIGTSGKVRHLRRSSLRGVAAYVLSRFTFFTHGVYGVPRAVARKPTINVWHGEAIKRFDPLLPTRSAPGRPADFHVGSTRLFAQASADASSSPPPVVIPSGYPRTAQLLMPCSDIALRSIGIDPEVPFVMWVPTFRRTRQVGATAAWDDTVGSPPDLDSGFESLLPELARRGVTLVVKPHPLDAQAHGLSGAVVLTDAHLMNARIPFYAVLARASGLVTDYSSVANEFLIVDRPIAYYIPDHMEYANGRGLQIADALDHLAGPVLDSPARMAEFAEAVICPVDHDPRREEARQWFGPLGSAESGMRVVQFLSDRGLPIRLDGPR